MVCCKIILTPKAIQFAKNNRKKRTDYSKNKPLYCIHYRGLENGSICVSLETLVQVAILSIFPSRKLKENFINSFAGTMMFPNESKTLYDWQYGRVNKYDPWEWDWRYTYND